MESEIDTILSVELGKSCNMEPVYIMNAVIAISKFCFGLSNGPHDNFNSIFSHDNLIAILSYDTFISHWFNANVSLLTTLRRLAFFRTRFNYQVSNTNNAVMWRRISNGRPCIIQIMSIFFGICDISTV